jgi:hypothetical protein
MSVRQGYLRCAHCGGLSVFLLSLSPIHESPEVKAAAIAKAKRESVAKRARMKRMRAGEIPSTGAIGLGVQVE